MSAAPFVIASPFLLIGAHLVRVARESGALPDRLLSAFFLGIATGVVPRLFALEMATSGQGISRTTFWLNTAANLAIACAVLSLAAFAWKVFRPGFRWAKNAVIAFAVALVGTMAGAASSLEASSGSSPATIAFSSVAVAALAWTFVECVLYYRGQRKRLALGLADPVVANRFLLWSIWTGAITLQGGVQLVLRAAVWGSGAGALISAGHDPGGHWLAWIAAAKGLVGIVAPAAVVSVFLSFSPPTAYLRWIRARHPRDRRATEGLP